MRGGSTLSPTGEAPRHALSWDEIERVERQSYSVFVDNLPPSITKGWLFQQFEWEGRITDIFLSRKQRESSQLPFAFIRYKSKQRAYMAISNLNGIEIRGHIISVNVARYKRSVEEMNRSVINKPI